MLPVVLPAEFTIGQLKSTLEELTSVPSERQKLLNLIKGKLPPDSAVLSSLNLKENHAFMLMGTPDAELLREPSDADLETVNDLDEMFFDDDDFNKQKNQKSLADYIEKTNIILINPLRPGKKLIVFDLDYTLFDCKSTANHITELARPGMHELLTECYKYYDICVWSQTAWKYLEMKITELGMLTHHAYRLAFVLDRTSMFSVMSKHKTGGELFKHQVKSLDIIWAKFPQFNAKNSIHIDDLGRNFAMNPQSGLKIHAFKNALMTRGTDVELYLLTRYLAQISLVDDFTKLDHKNWKSFDGPMPPDN